MKISPRNILLHLIALFSIVVFVSPSLVNANDDNYMETFPIPSPNTYIFSSASGIPWGQSFILHDTKYLQRIEFCGDNIASASLFENHDGIDVDTWGTPMKTVDVVKTDNICYTPALPWPYNLFLSGQNMYAHIAEFDVPIVDNQIYAVRIEPVVNSDLGIRLFAGSSNLYSEGSMLDPYGSGYSPMSQNQDVYLKIYYSLPPEPPEPPDPDAPKGRLFVNPQQKGSVKDEANDILCEKGLCKYNIAIGTQVQITAIPHDGYEFVRWSGTTCKGAKAMDNPCIFEMSEKEIAVPVFKKIHPKLSTQDSSTNDNDPDNDDKGKKNNPNSKGKKKGHK